MAIKPESNEKKAHLDTTTNDNATERCCVCKTSRSNAAFCGWSSAHTRAPVVASRCAQRKD